MDTAAYFRDNEHGGRTVDLAIVVIKEEETLQGPEVPARMTPTGRTFLVVCAAALVNLFLFPQAVQDRLSEFEPGAITDALISLMDIVSATSSRIGIPQMFEELRAGFLSQIGK
jgi:hypothetical protein